MSPIIDMQRRFTELGRIRMGERGSKGEPRKLTTWRITSASKQIVEAAAQVYGGTARAWQDGPEEGLFEVTTKASELEVLIPPVVAPGSLVSQFYETWTGGGCVRRCDGVTELISGKPCQCDPDERTCKITTRVNLMLPRLPGLGVFRLETHGFNAALTLPGTIDLLAVAGNGRPVPAVLRIEQKTKKVPGEGTRRFIVPVLDVPQATIGEIVEAATGGPALGPARPLARPALPQAADPPVGDAAAYELGNGQPAFGEAPPLPGEPEGAVAESGESGSAARPISEPERAPSGTVTAAQKKKLDVLVTRLRDTGRITTEQLWGRMATLRGMEVDQMVELLDGRDGDGVLHWSPLRESLSKGEASELIERLDAYAAQGAAA